MALSRRLLALAAAVAFGLSGSGLPMCASLLAQTAQPCGMHQHAEHHAAHGPQIVPDHPGDDACHPADGAVGCAAGGTCPAGGTAAPLAARSLVTALGATRAAAPGRTSEHRSFLSPPTPPPPQA
ncbi:MAG: hypothetical protein ACREMC_06285 [Gemmatimonadales bacterium]